MCGVGRQDISRPDKSFYDDDISACACQTGCAAAACSLLAVADASLWHAQDATCPLVTDAASPRCRYRFKAGSLLECEAIPPPKPNCGANTVYNATDNTCSCLARFQHVAGGRAGPRFIAAAHDHLPEGA
jgi:hypothetical protein